MVGFGGGLTWGAAVVRWVVDPALTDPRDARSERRWFRYQSGHMSSLQHRFGHMVDEWVESGSRLVERRGRTPRDQEREV